MNQFFNNIVENDYLKKYVLGENVLSHWILTYIDEKNYHAKVKCHIKRKNVVIAEVIDISHRWLFAKNVVTFCAKTIDDFTLNEYKLLHLYKIIF